MKILLTGGSGFIGRNLKESFLNEKHQIAAPSRDILDCFNDESVERFFLKNSFDVVIHSAAKPGHRNASDPHGILYTNSRMTINLLKHKDSWGKLLNMGSGAIYDMEHYQPEMPEEYAGTHVPVDEHGYNKYICNLLYPHYKNAIDFRIFGIFGKYEDYAIRFISNAICKTLFDLPITLRQNRKFDYLFIDDLAPIVDDFVSSQPQHIAYNITPDSSVELLKIATIIKEISNSKHDIVVAHGGLGREYSGNNARLKKEFSKITFTPIEVAIEKLYQWYRDNKQNLKKEYLIIDK